MGFFDYTGELIGQASTTFIGKPIQFVGKKFKSNFFTDVGKCVEQAGESSWKLIGTAGDGVTYTIAGVLNGKQEQRNKGLKSMKHVIETTGNSLGVAVEHAAENIRDVSEGILFQDYEKFKRGGKEILKVVVVGGVTIGIVDMINGQVTVSAAETDVSIMVDNTETLANSHPIDSTWESADVDENKSTPIPSVSNHDEFVLQTINSDLEGESHEETKVPFETSTIQLLNGDTVTGVFPDFEEVTAVTIPENMYLENDYSQFEAANSVLAQRVSDQPELQSRFSEVQLQQINLGETPDGYVWHHHETLGRLELVEESTHAMTGHTGGRFIWGGGTEYR